MPIDRIEAAIERLTVISADVKSMLAVHEQRINNQEKVTEDISDTLEKRREEFDTKLKDVYNTMRQQDNSILEHIEQLRKESAQQHESLNEKIGKLEKYIWLAIGGGMVAVWALSYVANFFKILGH
jgi:conjugal transfer/entry exclusion protein